MSPLVGTAGPDPAPPLPGDPGRAPGNPRALLLGRVQFSVLTSLCLGPTVVAVLGQALPDGPSEAGPISTGLPSTAGHGGGPAPGASSAVCHCSASALCASNCAAACFHIFS